MALVKCESIGETLLLFIRDPLKCLLTLPFITSIFFSLHIMNIFNVIKKYGTISMLCEKLFF